MNSIGENIKNFRTFRNIKQQDLANQLGKSKSVISNWERGENSPDVEICAKLCHLLRVTPNQLFGWEPNPEYEKFKSELEKARKELKSLYEKRDQINKEIELARTRFKDELPIEYYDQVLNVDEEILNASQKIKDAYNKGLNQA